MGSVAHKSSLPTSQTPVNRGIFITAVPCHFLGLFGRGENERVRGIIGQFSLADALKKWMGVEMAYHPVMQVQHIRAGVENTSFAKDVRVLALSVSCHMCAMWT